MTRAPHKPTDPPPAETALVLRLEEISAAMLPTVGGKAANLGELTRAGLPVPPGFCLTTEAYRQVAASVPGPELATVLDALDAAPTPAELAQLAARARKALLGVPVPAVIRDGVAAAYQALGPEVPVAVRSSATAEDLPSASFAGQQDTYLNVVGPAEVSDAVQRCWASLWTERAVSYRAANGVDHRAVRLAVVVQRMVDAEVAGVMFTANPVTGRRGETVIDANPGLGEAVVSGAVNPDRFVVDGERGDIRERRLGDKRLTIRALAGGGTQTRRSSGDADRACLTDRQLRELTTLGQRVQRHYGAPQDTEWALGADGTLWLTQARPITTLYPLPDEPADGIRVYFCASLAQGLVGPITPMGLAAFRAMSSGFSIRTGGPVTDPLAGSELMVTAGARLFLDVTGALASPAGGRLLPRVLDVMEARSAVVLRSLATERTGSWWPFLRRMLPVLVRYRIPPRVVFGALCPAAARRRLDRFGQQLRARLARRQGLTPEQRLDVARELLNSSFLPIAATVGPVALGSAFGMFGLASALLGKDAGPGELAGVLRGLPHNVTTEMDLQLWALAGRLGADDEARRALTDIPAAELCRRYRTGELPRALRSGVAEFLGRWGHRAVAEIDLGLPRWSEDPRHIFGVLANYLRVTDPAAAPDAQFRNGAAAAEETIQRLVARAGGLRGVLVGFALRRARELAGLRELPKYHFIEVLASVRRELTEVAEALVAAGRIDAVDDLFFLTLAEAGQALHGSDPRTLIAGRREQYQDERHRRRVPRVLLSDGTEPEALAKVAVDENGLVGTAASTGTVTGIARVVLDPVGAHLEPGEILVAPSTDPGWTPLFLTAGALVMEMGGANSHGAVVAREYGIPAVVGVADATTRITTGDRVTVHGASGLITLHPADG
jgi:pyruvate,water dikinase